MKKPYEVLFEKINLIQTQFFNDSQLSEFLLELETKGIFIKLNDDKGMAKCENLIVTLYGEKGEVKLSKKHFQKGLNKLNKITI